MASGRQLLITVPAEQKIDQEAASRQFQQFKLNMKREIERNVNATAVDRPLIIANIMKLKSEIIDFFLNSNLSSQLLCNILFSKKTGFFSSSVPEFVFLFKCFLQSESTTLIKIFSKASLAITSAQKELVASHLFRPNFNDDYYDGRTFITYINFFGFEVLQALVQYDKNIYNKMIDSYHSYSFRHRSARTNQFIIRQAEYLKLLKESSLASVTSSLIKAAKAKDSLITEANLDIIQAWIKMLGPFTFGAILTHLGSDALNCDIHLKLRENDLPEKSAEIKNLYSLVNDAVALFKEDPEEFVKTIQQFLPSIGVESPEYFESNTRFGEAILITMIEYLAEKWKTNPLSEKYRNLFYAFLVNLCHHEQQVQSQKANETATELSNYYRSKVFKFCSRISSAEHLPANYNHLIGMLLLKSDNKNREIEIQAYKHLHQAALAKNFSAMKFLKRLLKPDFAPNATIFFSPGHAAKKDLDNESKEPISNEKPASFIAWTTHDDDCFHLFINKLRLDYNKKQGLDMIIIVLSQLEKTITEEVKDSSEKIKVIEKIHAISAIFNGKEDLLADKLVSVNDLIMSLSENVTSLAVLSEKLNIITQKMDALLMVMQAIIKAISIFDKNQKLETLLKEPLTVASSSPRLG